MPERIIYMIEAAGVIAFLVVSFILVCCICAAGKSNHGKESDREQERELTKKTRKKG